MSPDETHAATYERGLETRRAVLGSEHVDRSLAAATDFSRPIQELVTEYCWGVIWNGDGLDRRTRSLLNLAMLTVLNRSHELAAHVRAVPGRADQAASGQDVQDLAVLVVMPECARSGRERDGVDGHAVGGGQHGVGPHSASESVSALAGRKLAAAAWCDDHVFASGWLWSLTPPLMSPMASTTVLLISSA